MDGKSAPGDPLTARIISCAIAVHRELGPGLLETTYQNALCLELQAQALSFVRQLPLPLYYRSQPIGEYRLDLLVEDAVIVEIKSVERFDPVFEAQVLTYLRAARKRVGLLINFNSALITRSVRRYVL